LANDQYTLDESNPLQSITHERDLDEFLANAALADTDFMTGQLN
jgi:large subunit GTPase 1